MKVNGEFSQSEMLFCIAHRHGEVPRSDLDRLRLTSFGTEFNTQCGEVLLQGRPEIARTGLHKPPQGFNHTSPGFWPPANDTDLGFFDSLEKARDRWILLEPSKVLETTGGDGFTKSC